MVDARVDVVVVDGVEYAVVWHGALVHPVSGVKGGLMTYPLRSLGAVDDEPIRERPAAPAGAQVCVCARPGCGTVRRLPPWQARQFRYCGKRCAALDRRQGELGCPV